MQMTRRQHERMASLDGGPKPAPPGSDLEAMVAMDHRGLVVEFDPAAEEMFGLAREAAIGRRLDELIVPPLLREHHQAALQRYVTGQSRTVTAKRLEVIAMRADGSEFPVEVTFTAIPGSDASVLFIGLIRDITERNRNRHELERARELNQLVLDHTQDLISLVDPSGVIRYVSPSHQRVMGYAEDELLEASVLDFVHPEDAAMIAQRMAESVASGEGGFVSEIRIRHKDGRWMILEGRGSIIVRPGEQPVILASARDITDRKRAEEQIAFLAYHDKLTGLPNRARFDELLAMGLARARRHDMALAVLYLDLDDFKAVNDTLGHAAGDELLRQLGQRLLAASRETDGVARLGGDEFMVVVPDLPRLAGTDPGSADSPVSVAETVARRIHDALGQAFALGDAEASVTASIGVSIFPFDADDTGKLFRNADMAMYESKRGGPGRSTFFAGTAPTG